MSAETSSRQKEPNEARHNRTYERYICGHRWTLVKLHVGQGTTVGALTVFPVWSARPSARRHYVTTMGEATIAETPEPTVEHLSVTNHGAQSLLILDGQLFDGGLQHRMATRSTVIAAGHEHVIDVVCVEEHRWGGSSAQSSSGNRAPAFVRAGQDEPDGQMEVWRRVARVAGASSGTGSLVAAQHRANEQARLVVLHARPTAGQTGVVIGIGGQPVTLENFDHPDTLREQFAAIVRAASLDAIGRPAIATPGRRARRMIRRLEDATLDMEPKLGQTSTLGRARTPDLDVMALRHASRIVHLRAIHRRHPILQGA